VDSIEFHSKEEAAACADDDADDTKGKRVDYFHHFVLSSSDSDCPYRLDCILRLKSYFFIVASPLPLLRRHRHTCRSNV